jgi:lysophospholipase L1-like esterase
LAEGIVRLFPDVIPAEARLRVHWGRVVAKTISSAHPYIGFVYPPHYEGEIVSGKFRFTYNTDGHGFRNPWPWPERAEIVAVGDSLTFGYGVEDDQAWSSLLDRSLPHTHVVNLALIGSAPQQYLRVYETFGTDLKPKVLLFGLFPGNDVKDAGTFDEWQAAGSEGNYDVWRFFRGRIPRPAQGIKHYLKKSYLVLCLREAWRLYRLPGKTRITALDFPDGGRLQLFFYTSWWQSVEASEDHPDFQLILQTVEKARTSTRQQGTELLVLLLPTREEVYLPLLGEESPDDSGPFRAAFEERGIPYLDLTPAFRKRAKAHEQLFFEVDGHPNVAGNALIAEEVLTHLRENAALYGLTDWHAFALPADFPVRSRSSSALPSDRP